MGLDDAPMDERNRFWDEHNKVLRTQSDHGQRLVVVEGRMERLETLNTEQYGAMCNKLDALGVELRGMTDRAIAEKATLEERERIREQREREHEKSLSMKWPLAFAALSALSAIGMLVVTIMTFTG